MGVVVVLASVSATSVAATGTGGVGRLFVHGANVCRLVSTAKLDTVMGVRFPPPVRKGAFCRWAIPGGRVTESVTLDVERGLHQRIQPDRRMTITKVKLPGAEYAAVQSAGYRGAVRDSVVIDFRQGTIRVGVLAKNLTISRALAATEALIS